jgi:hypothetical protein
MAMADTQEKPGVTERYLAATETSNLTLLDHRMGAPDLLIAAGLSEETVGNALVRLMGEWDSSAKPRMPTTANIKAVAQAMRVSDASQKAAAELHSRPYKSPGKAEVRARAEAIGWYSRELRLFAQGLKSRAECVEHVRQWFALKGMDEDYAGAALYHWLEPNCPVCEGRGKVKPPDAPVLTRQCHACSGTGRTPLTDTAFRAAEWLSGCLGRAKRAMEGNRESVKAAKRWIAEKR